MRRSAHRSATVPPSGRDDIRMLVRRPAPPLAQLVERIWYFESNLPHRRERILPGGTMQLLVNLDRDELCSHHGLEHPAEHAIRGAAIVGSFTRPFAIDTTQQRRIAGITFFPGGAAPFLPIPCTELTEQHVALQDVWGDDGATIRERLLEAGSAEAILATLEALLHQWWERGPIPGSGVQLALRALERGRSVAEVLGRLGISHGRFVRGFSAAVGLTPKRFARVRRFRRVLAALGHGQPVDWADVAATCGYYDQAHLIRDFRQHAGMRPTAYLPRWAGEDGHVILPE